MAVKYAYPFEEIPFDSEDFADISHKQLLDLLSQNGILLTFYKNLSKACSKHQVARQLMELIEDIIRKRRHIIVNFYQKLQDTADLFNKCYINYLFPKFPFFYKEQGDIDVLVSPKDFEKSLSFLRVRGYTPVVEEPYKVTMARWEGERIITIDVYANLAWQPFYLKLIPSEILLRNSIYISLDHQMSVPIPSGEYCILVLVAHSLYGSGKVTLSDIFQMMGILHRFSDINWHAIINIVSNGGWCQDLQFFLRIINHYSCLFYRKLVVPSKIINLIEEKMSTFKKSTNSLFIGSNVYSIPYYRSPLQTLLSSTSVAFKKYRVLALQKLFKRYLTKRPRERGFIEDSFLRIPWFYRKIMKEQSMPCSQPPSERL